MSPEVKEKSLYEQFKEMHGVVSKEALESFPAPRDIADGETITVKDLDLLVSDIFKAQQVIESAGEVVTAMNKKLAEMKGKGVRYLKALDREDYKSDAGSIRISQKWRVGMPATPEDKMAFFAYLRSKNLFDHYATIHSQSLNSYYMEEWEAAKKIGEGMTFSLPGIPQPKLFEDLGTTKSRKKKEDEND